MQGSALVWDQVVEMCQTREKRSLMSIGMMEAFHSKKFAVYGVVRLVQYRAHRRHPGVCKYRVPARLFGLEPVAYALAVSFAHRRVDTLGKGGANAGLVPPPAGFCAVDTSAARCGTLTAAPGVPKPIRRPACPAAY